MIITFTLVMDQIEIIRHTALREMVLGCEAAPDGNGILRQEIASIRTMETNYYRGTLQNGTLTFDTTPLYTSDYSTDYSTFPVQKILNWMDISDMSGLN